MPGPSISAPPIAARGPAPPAAARRAPLARPTWYAASSAEPALAAEPLHGAAGCDIAIVGGGLAGLAVALSLAERGAAPLLVEAGTIGQGASGANGGMVSAGFSRSSLELARRLGQGAARAMHGESLAALRLLRARVQRHAVATAIVEGVVEASMFEDEAALGRHAEALNRDFAMRLEAEGVAWLRQRYRTGRYRAALFDPDGFHLDPLALARGYARAALGLGVRLHERSPVLALEAPARPGRPWRLRTATAEIDAVSVVLCTSAYGDALWPRLRRALLGVETYVLVTEPLGRRLEEAIAAPYAVYDDRFAVGYYRPLFLPAAAPGGAPTASGRLLWGGRVALGAAPRDLERVMRRDLGFVYPQLEDVPIAAVWSGTMGFARHKMPLLGRLAPGLWVSTAYGGQGVGATTMGGELVARALLQDDPAIDLFARFEAAPTFGPAGRLAARAITFGHALRDGWRMRAHRQRSRP